MFDQIATGIVALIALLAGGKMAWDKWQSIPAKEKPPTRVINAPLLANDPDTAPLNNTTRAEAFASVDALIHHFGEEGNRAGVEAAKSAGKALFDSTELDVE